MKVLLLGSLGQLGQDLLRTFPHHWQIFPLTRDQVDLCQSESIRSLFDGKSVDVIISAVPWQMNIRLIQQALEAKRSFIDLGNEPEWFWHEFRKHDEEAKKAGIALVPDCGLAPGLANVLAADAVAAGLIDEIQPVPGAEALRCARELARAEGVLCGISGGATFGVAMQVAERAPEGSVMLAMLPDTGERYLSTVLYEDLR